MFLFVQATYIGFVLQSSHSNGDCKTIADWRADIAALESWSIISAGPSGNSVGFSSGDSYGASEASQSSGSSGVSQGTSGISGTTFASFSQSGNSLDGNSPPHGVSSESGNGASGGNHQGLSSGKSRIGTWNEELAIRITGVLYCNPIETLIP